MIVEEVMTVEEWKRKNPPIRRKPLTNADRIRKMTDEELADIILNRSLSFYCDAKIKEDCRNRDLESPYKCFDCVMKWLQKEETEEDR